MVIALERLQIEIGGMVIGAGTDVTIAKIEGLGTAGLRDRRYENSGEDGEQFGREYRMGRDIQITGQVKMPGDEVGAWDTSNALGSIFDGEAVRKTARAVSTMRIQRPGAPTKIVFGRPNTYEPDIDRAVVGLIPFTAIFRCSDNRFYSDDEHSAQIALSSPSSGGLVTVAGGGLPSPIVTIAGDVRSTIVDQAGDTDAWPIVEFKGPLLNPSATLTGLVGGARWTLGIEGSLQYDETAVIDTRPWSRKAALSNGSPLPGRLTRASAPSRSAMPPGSWDVVVSGTDPTGTSRFNIRWRDAYREL